MQHWELIIFQLISGSMYDILSIYHKKDTCMNNLRVDALEAGILQLKKGFVEASKHPSNELMRDGVIQRFEYTMDLAWKLMQRYLKLIQIDESVIRSKNDIFREAARLKIINSAEAWIGYYAARNETVPDYNTEKAALVYEKAKLFLPDVTLLLETLRDIN